MRYILTAVIGLIVGYFCFDNNPAKNVKLNRVLNDSNNKTIIITHGNNSPAITGDSIYVSYGDSMVIKNY